MVNVDYDELYRKYDFFDAEPPLEQRFRGVVSHASPPVDAYLFLTQMTSKDFIGQSNQLLHGLAIYRRVGYGMHLYAACNLYLVDAKDFRIIAQTPLLMDLGEPTTWQVLSGRRFQRVGLPYRPVDKSLHPAKSWEDFNEAQRAWIKRGVSEIFDESIPLSLKKMGLGR